MDDNLNHGVKTLHPEYMMNACKWTQVDAVVGNTVKDGTDRTVYLPKPGAAIDKCCPSRDMYASDSLYNAAYAKWDNDRKANDERYEQYIKRALFYNFTKRTLSGFVGQVFRKHPTCEKPEQMYYLESDCDGRGNGIDQQAKQVLGEVLKKGRAGILVDIPGDLGSKEDQITGKKAPKMTGYKAQDILNWSYEVVGAVRVLKMVVLREQYEYKVDEFYSQYYDQYRVLTFDDKGYYIQKLYKMAINEEQAKVETIEVKVNNQRIDYLPFYFVGADNNDFTVDESPLYDLSEINIAHYQCSADHFESSHQASQATLVVSLGDINPEAFNKANPTGLSVGARSGIILGNGGRADYIQAKETNLAKESMRALEDMAIQIGASLITKSSNETAEAARIKHGADTSVLASVAHNVSQAYEDAIKMCARFLGLPEDEITYSLNTEFELDQMDAQMLAQWMAGVMQGQIPTSYFNEKMRKTGNFPVDATDEDIAKELEASGQGGGMYDDQKPPADDDEEENTDEVNNADQ